MRLLLDTHTLLWLLKGSSELSQHARTVIRDPGNEKLLSVGSLWEITIKSSAGKLLLGRSLRDFFVQIEETRMIQQLPVLADHLLWLSTLPLHHRDPFDRLIVAQALGEKCMVVSRDTQLDAYGISRLW